MRTFVCCSGILAALMTIPSVALSHVVETFILPMEPVAVWRSTFMDRGRRVGPQGDMWLTLPMPQRLIRISGDQMECVLDSGVMNIAAPNLTVSPDGTLWIGLFEYIYSPDNGLRTSDVEIPQSSYGFHVYGPPMIDADCRMFLHGNSTYFGKQSSSSSWEVKSCQSPAMVFETYYLHWPFFVSAEEFWATASNSMVDTGQLCEIDLNAGIVKTEYNQRYISFEAKDSEGIFWDSGSGGIVTFDRQDVFLYCESGDGVRFQWPMVLTADWTIWLGAYSDQSEPRGVFRIQGEERRLFTVDDGLLTNSCWWPKVDYDGCVWLFNANDEGIIGLSRITDGGWPPMRLMLHRLETPESISVEAQVINNGPVVGVDVYVALELNGQLLYWPNWQRAPSRVQVNLRPGHNQTATIISAPRSSIPPGAYTFWACMTGRGTQKLIGPLDRKFETLTIHVD